MTSLGGPTGVRTFRDPTQWNFWGNERTGTVGWRPYPSSLGGPKGRERGVTKGSRSRHSTSVTETTPAPQGQVGSRGQCPVWVSCPFTLQETQIETNTSIK